MKHYFTILKATLLSACYIWIGASFAQSTFSGVHSILQTNCTISCHNGSTYSGQLDLSGTETDVYNNIVNVNPVNPAALAKGDKLIDPGYPERSFLIRKCNSG